MWERKRVEVTDKPITCTRNDTHTHTPVVQLQFNTPFCSGRAWMYVCLLNTLLCQSSVCSDITSWRWNREVVSEAFGFESKCPTWTLCWEAKHMFFITILLLYIKIPNPGSRTQDLISLKHGAILLLPFYVCVCVYAMWKTGLLWDSYNVKNDHVKSLTHTDNNQMLSVVLYLLCEILLNIIHTLNTVKNYLRRKRK